MNSLQHTNDRISLQTENFHPKYPHPRGRWRLLPPALLCLLLSAATLLAQTTPQTGTQAGTQTTAQTGTQTGTQTTAQTTAQTGTQPSPQIIPLQPGGYDPLGPQHPTIITPLTQPTLTPGILTLMELEGRFSQAVAKGGGKAFAEWFADDAVALNNGRSPVLGRTSIARDAQWKAADYQLTWIPEGAQMGPSNDMGFTWGHYEGRSKDKAGQPVLTSGRYITVWRKQANGQWKVALDASADEPPTSCCTLPKP